MKLLFIIVLTLLPFTAQAANHQSLEKLMSDWLNLERQKGKLQTDWNTRKEQLDRRLALLESEQEVLEEAIAEAGKEKSDVDERRLTLLEAQDRLEREQAALDARLQKATASAQVLINRLPPPLREQWEERMPLLAEHGATNSEKLDRLLGLFKLVEEFNDRVALHRTAMQLSDSAGQPRTLLVTQIYLGASQGWYVSDDGKVYGYGRATKLGWYWWHGEEASKELGRELDPQALLRVLDTLENPTRATFLALPLKL